MRSFAISALSLLCIGTILGNADAIQAQANPKLADAIDSIRPSVVKVVVKLVRSPANPFPQVPEAFKGCFNDTSVCIVGTGFFVNSNGDVVTAFHVVDGFRAKSGAYIRGTRQVIEALEAAGVHAGIGIGVATPNFEKGGITVLSNTQLYSAELVATDPSHDLALIRPTANPFRGMPQLIGGQALADMPRPTVKDVTFSLSRPRDGEDVFACGYPFSEPGLITTSGILASAWNSEVLLRAEAAGFPSPQNVYTVDLRINPGDSGGPVFRMFDQAVIGVAVETRGGLALVVPAKLVTDFLTSQHVSWTPAKTASGESFKPK